MGRFRGSILRCSFFPFLRDSQNRISDIFARYRGSLGLKQKIEKKKTKRRKVSRKYAAICKLSLSRLDIKFSFEENSHTTRTKSRSIYSIADRATSFSRRRRDSSRRDRRGPVTLRVIDLKPFPENSSSRVETKPRFGVVRIRAESLCPLLRLYFASPYASSVKRGDREREKSD